MFSNLSFLFSYCKEKNQDGRSLKITATEASTSRPRGWQALPLVLIFCYPFSLSDTDNINHNWIQRALRHDIIKHRHQITNYYVPLPHCHLWLWKQIKCPISFLQLKINVFFFLIVMVFAIHWHESAMVYMCSPSRSPLPPPYPTHPSGSSQCTSPEHLSHPSNLGWWSVSL